MPFSLRFPIALVLLIVCLATPAWADFQAGVDAYKRKDYATALREWQPLAEQGDARSQLKLGEMYYFGFGVSMDYGRARQWFEKAAKNGDKEAQRLLGVLFYYGFGVPQDYKQAHQWYKKAATQGMSLAQSSIGDLYEKGHGVPQDFVQAHKWYNLAAANGDKLAARDRDALAKQMTSTQIEEAQRLAREWKPIKK